MEHIGNSFMLLNQKQGTKSKILFVMDQIHEVPYVLKGPLIDKSDDTQQAVANIVREAKIWEGIDRHRNIAHCHGHFQNEGLPFLVVEHVDGPSLREWGRSETFELGLLLDIFIQIADGLEFLHTTCNLVHGDIKPDNIMMAPNFTPKIIDFQHTVSLKDSREQSSPIGTFPYGIGYINNRGDLRRGETLAYLMMLAELTFGTDSLLDRVPPAISTILGIPEHWQPLTIGKVTGAIPQKLADLIMESLEANASGKQIRSLKECRDELLSIYENWVGEGILEVPARNSINAVLQNLANGNLRGAKNELLQLSELYPNEPMIWSLLGSVFANLNEYDESVKYSENALRLNSRDQRALLNIASILSMQGRLTEGSEKLREVLHFYPRNSNGWANLAQTYFQLRKVQLAFLSYAKLYAIDPEDTLVKDLIKAAEQTQTDPQSIAIANSVKYSEIWYPKRYQPDIETVNSSRSRSKSEKTTGNDIPVTDLVRSMETDQDISLNNPPIRDKADLIIYRANELIQAGSDQAVDQLIEAIKNELDSSAIMIKIANRLWGKGFYKIVLIPLQIFEK